MKKKFRYNKTWGTIAKYDGVTLPTLKKRPLVKRNSKVCLMGSCFADEMGWCLREHGINIGEVGEVKELKHVLYQWGTFFNPQNLFDCLDRVINSSWEVKDQHFAYMESEKVYWYLFMKIRAHSDNIDFVKRRLHEVERYWRYWLSESDVVVITLGLIEAWIDLENGRSWQEFAGQVLTGKSHENRAYFKVLSYEECLEYVGKCVRLINELGEKKNIIITVSPIPLAYTFRDKDIIIANRYSKSVLRVVAEEY